MLQAIKYRSTVLQEHHIFAGIGISTMSSCECEEHITGLYEELTTLYLELKKLSAENNSIQRSLVDIKLLLMDKKQSLKEELVRQRERTW